jgi:D-amino-acid dehydrogenase
MQEAGEVSAPDVAVVGGGVIGVCCALELARAGAAVTLIEAGPGLGAGCSAGSAGLLIPSHAAPLATRAALVQGLRWSLSRQSPLALHPRPALVPWLLRFAAACTPSRERAATELVRRLAGESLELHEALRDQVGVRLERSGTLNVFETEAGLEEGRRHALEHARAGLRSQTLTSVEAARLEPALAPGFAGAIHYPDELSGDPLDFVLRVGAAARAAGTDIRTGTQVRALRARGGRIEGLETTAGCLAPATVVLAAGVWTPGLVRSLDLPLPLEGGKGYHLDFARAASDPHLPLFLQEARVVATPFEGRLRLAGTLELAGLDLSLDPRRLAPIERAGGRRIDGLAGRRPLAAWCGLRPCAPDGLPVLGRPRRYDNLVLATAHAMLGFTLAPLTGKLVAGLVAGGAPRPDLAPLQPDRFAAAHAVPGLHAHRR